MYKYGEQELIRDSKKMNKRVLNVRGNMKVSKIN